MEEPQCQAQAYTSALFIHSSLRSVAMHSLSPCFLPGLAARGSCVNQRRAGGTPQAGLGGASWNPNGKAGQRDPPAKAERWEGVPGRTLYLPWMQAQSRDLSIPGTPTCGHPSLNAGTGGERQGTGKGWAAGLRE